MKAFYVELASFRVVLTRADLFTFAIAIRNHSEMVKSENCLGIAFNPGFVYYYYWRREIHICSLAHRTIFFRNFTLAHISLIHMKKEKSFNFIKQKSFRFPPLSYTFERIAKVRLAEVFFGSKFLIKLDNSVERRKESLTFYGAFFGRIF
jgi:hypothetical protein